MRNLVPGLSAGSLFAAWREVRKDIRRSSIRDVVDHLEYDLDPKVWIRTLLRQIADGSYEPHLPERFTLGKSNGFSRKMTCPRVPDIVLYRAVVDILYRKVRPREHPHVYFERAAIEEHRKGFTEEERVRRDADPSLREMATWLMDYETGSNARFRAWLHYDQYRRHLIFKRVYPFIVITDITNFFDSVLFSRVTESLHEISAPPQLVNLLFLLLERLCVRGSLGECPRIGLPVDQFDCSRKLAHVVLFPHDDRMVKAAGEDAFVRYMDDQNFGASSRAEGLRILAKNL